MLIYNRVRNVSLFFSVSRDCLSCDRKMVDLVSLMLFYILSHNTAIGHIDGNKIINDIIYLKLHVILVKV